MTTAVASVTQSISAPPALPVTPDVPKVLDTPSVPLKLQWDWSPEPAAIRAWVSTLPRRATIGQCSHSYHCVVAEYILAGQHLFGVMPPSLSAPAHYFTVEVTPANPEEEEMVDVPEILIERWGDLGSYGSAVSAAIPMSPALSALANAYDALDPHPESYEPHIPTRTEVLGLFG